MRSLRANSYESAEFHAGFKYDPETPLESLCRPIEFSPDFDLCNVAPRNIESEPQLGSTGSKIAFFMPELLEVRLGSQGF